MGIEFSHDIVNMYIREVTILTCGMFGMFARINMVKVKVKYVIRKFRGL